MTGVANSKPTPDDYPNSEEINHNFQKLDDMILVRTANTKNLPHCRT